jgi:hypothetical protein
MIAWLRVATLLCIPVLIGTTDGQTKKSNDVRYLVIRRAGHPEKNYYELAKHVGLFDWDVVTNEPAGIRYGVHSIWKVRVQRITDSQKDSVSANDAYYVLIYERDPDNRFCGLRYKVSTHGSGARRIEYTDCEDKKEYSFEMSREWPRPFVIYEVAILNRDVLRELWEAEKRKRSSEQNESSIQDKR